MAETNHIIIVPSAIEITITSVAKILSEYYRDSIPIPVTFLALDGQRTYNINYTVGYLTDARPGLDSELGLIHGGRRVAIEILIATELQRRLGVVLSKAIAFSLESSRTSAEVEIPGLIFDRSSGLVRANRDSFFMEFFNLSKPLEHPNPYEFEFERNAVGFEITEISLQSPVTQRAVIKNILVAGQAAVVIAALSQPPVHMPIDQTNPPTSQTTKIVNQTPSKSVSQPQDGFWNHIDLTALVKDAEEIIKDAASGYGIYNFYKDSRSKKNKQQQKIFRILVNQLQKNDATGLHHCLFQLGFYKGPMEPTISVTTQGAITEFLLSQSMPISTAPNDASFLDKLATAAANKGVILGEGEK